MIQKKKIRIFVFCTLAVLIAAMSISIPACADQQQITVKSGGIRLNLNGRPLFFKTLDTDTAGKPLNYNNTIYVPADSFSNALGLTASYDSSSKTLSLTGNLNITETTVPAPPSEPPNAVSKGAINIPPKENSSTSESAAGIPPKEAESVEKNIKVTFNNIKITLNGKLLSLTDSKGNAIEPFNYEGTVYIPLKAVSETLGLTVLYDSNKKEVNISDGTQPSVGMPPSGAKDSENVSSVTKTAIYTLDGDSANKSNQTYTATDTNESGIIVTNKGTLNLSNSTIKKTGGDSSSEETSNFIGINAGILAEEGGKIIIDNCKIYTNAAGSNAIFSTGEGTSISASAITIHTTKNSSRGLDATYGGTITAKNVNIITEGAHCAALATDRGEGTITVSGGTLSTAGEGSPGIYSTGNITVSNITSTATGSEAAVIEGKNSITLTDCNLSGSLKHGVMIYQSFSGDADEGTGIFTMTGGSLKASEGPLFYSTNTNAVINLKKVNLTSSSEILLKAAADKWGNSGENGATVFLNAENQVLNGNIQADSISSVNIKLKSSSLKGSVNTENTAKAASLSIDKTSKWIVTGNSFLNSLTDEDTTLSNIDDNGFNIYYDPDNSSNSWLNKKTVTLSDGGKLIPITNK